MQFRKRVVLSWLFCQAYSFLYAATDQPFQIISLTGQAEIQSDTKTSLLSPGTGYLVPWGRKIRVNDGHLVLGRGTVAVHAEAGSAFLCSQENDPAAFRIRVENESEPVQIEAGGNLISLPAGAGVRVENSESGPPSVAILEGQATAQSEDGQLRYYTAGQKIDDRRQARQTAAKPNSQRGSRRQPVISPSAPADQSL